MKKTLLALAWLASSVGMAQAGALLTEDFNDVSTLTGKGWIQNNQSAPIGTTGWFQGNSGVFAAASGPANSYIAANYQNAAAGGTISNWLLTPTLSIFNGDTLNFSLRLLADGFLDTVEVYVSTKGASTSLGDFSLVQTFASGVDTGWTNESVVIAAAGTGRYAFRYFVDNTNLNGNYVGIDSVLVNSVPEPTSMALFGIAALGLALSRRKIAPKALTD